MSDVSIFLGLDVHKDSIDIALVEGDRKATVRFYGTVGGDLADLEKAVRKIRKAHPFAVFHFVYEAGLCGYPTRVYQSELLIGRLSFQVFPNYFVQVELVHLHQSRTGNSPPEIGRVLCKWHQGAGKPSPLWKTIKPFTTVCSPRGGRARADNR